MKKIIISLLLGCGLVGSVNAAGDIEAGKAKAAMCAACHGATGHSSVEMYPNLAGQHAEYLVKQLKAFKAGTRVSPVMAPMAAGLSDQDMENLAAFFASQPRNLEQAKSADTSGSATASTSTPQPAAFEPDAAAGKSLYQLGDASRNIVACVECHGKEGHSDVLINPNLAKQHPEYIEKQLRHFKSGERKNPAMNLFSKKLSDHDIQNIAAYLADPNTVANVKAKKVSAPAAMGKNAIAGKAKAATCAACHGPDGNAPIAMYPKLAGQHQKYLLKQLHDFKDGARENAVMAPMVAGLSDQDMIDLSAYFASQKETKGNGKDNELGRKLYVSGDVNRQIPACSACHLVEGKGLGPAGFPKISSQNVEYIVAQLKEFKKGTRHNDINGMMRNVAIKLTDEDIDAVAQYISSMN